MEFFSNPLAVVAGTEMCHMLLTKSSFHLVNGTTILTASFPIASELMTTAGLVLLISDPTVGSNLTHHTSPRFGVSVVGLVMDRAGEGEPVFHLWIRLVVGDQLLGLGCHDLPALGNWQTQEGLAVNVVFGLCFSALKHSAIGLSGESFHDGLVAVRRWNWIVTGRA